MKIAISAQESSPNSTMDKRFGRAKCFILYNTVDQSTEVLENTQNKQAAQGAGIQAAQTVVDVGAEAVLTGHCGPKAFKALSAADVKIYVDLQGTVREAIEAFNKGQLTVAETADVQGHW